MNKLLFFSFIIFCCFTLCLSKSAYSTDGSGNNQKFPSYGQTNTVTLRRGAVAYEDKISVPRGGNPSTLKSPREISNVIFARKAPGSRPYNPKLVSQVLTFWGQFLDHDITLSDEGHPCEPFPIPIPRGDPFYDAENTGTKTMNFCRTKPFPGTGTNTSNPRQFPNEVTAWIDGSMVYGSTEHRARLMRTFQGGLMKTSQGPDGELLPLNVNSSGQVMFGMANAAKRVNDTQLYASGDVRANENPILASFHTLFIREHNRRAKLLPNSMSDEEKYQEARRWVIGHIQSITFNEYLPTLFGRSMPAYKGYDESINPQIDIFFSTVAFRYGHDQVNGAFIRLNPNGTIFHDGNILLRDSFFWPPALGTVGIGPYLRGISVNPQHLVDCMLEEDIRTFLFSQSPAFATDLAARNLQRARDHGIGTYNAARSAYGLSTCNTFSCVCKDPNAVAMLNSVYGTDRVDLLDPFVGGLLEPKQGESNLGELFNVAIMEQFERLRHGDRFWFERPGVFSKGELAVLKATKLSDIIRWNTDTKTIPKDVFRRNNRAPGLNLNPEPSNTKWIIGIVIPSVVAGILIIVVIGMCASNAKGGRGRAVNSKDNQLYDNLLEDK